MHSEETSQLPEVRVPGEVVASYGLLSVRAMLNGQYPIYHLLVDTGATHTAFLPEIIQSFQLPDIGTIQRIVPGDLQLTQTTVYRLNILWLVVDSQQSLEIADLEVIITEWPRRLGVDGVLGMNYLRNFPRICLDLETPALEFHLAE